jgi:hypothetical protein
LIGIQALYDVNVLIFNDMQAFLKLFIPAIKYSKRREEQQSGFKRSKIIAYKISVETPNGKRQLERPAYRYESSTEIGLKVTARENVNRTQLAG